MEKAHSAINWENYPSIDTPLNETNLNRMDSAVGIIDDRVIALDTSKATKTEVANALVDVSMDGASGIFTFTRKNGAKVTIDTKLERLAVNFRYDSTNQRLVITLDNGETQYVDVSALVTQYEFLESDAIAWEVANGTVRPYIKGGSITDSMIESNYLANLTVQAQNAKQSEQNAKISETVSVSSAEICSSAAEEINRKLQLAEFDIDDNGNLIYTDTSAYAFSVDDNGLLNWEVA